MKKRKSLLKALSKRADCDTQVVRQAFQLEIEKFSAYAVVSQLRQYIPAVQWVGGLRC